MNGLEAYFGGQIDFIHLDTDNSLHLRAGQKVGLWRHTQYLLLDTEGNILHEWNGYLKEETMMDLIEAELARSSIHE